MSKPENTSRHEGCVNFLYVALTQQLKISDALKKLSASYETYVKDLDQAIKQFDAGLVTEQEVAQVLMSKPDLTL